MAGVGLAVVGEMDGGFLQNPVTWTACETLGVHGPLNCLEELVRSGRGKQLVTSERQMEQESLLVSSLDYEGFPQAACCSGKPKAERHDSNCCEAM